MNKALLIIIDGCRPEAIDAVDTPNIHRLMDQGAYTLEARTVSPSITLPAHFSIFTSLKPSSHGIVTNWTRPSTSVQALSITALAKYAGLSTAALYGWEFLRDLAPPGCLDLAMFSQVNGLPDGDVQTARAAIGHILNNRPDFCFIYLGLLDAAGHRHGFMSKPYLETLEYADQAVGIILSALDRLGPEEGYHVILHSDHGGMGFGHEEDRLENKTIPYMVWGPSIRAGHRIESAVSVLDTAPTLARILGIAPHYQWEGHALSECFKSDPIPLPLRTPTDITFPDITLHAKG